MLENKVKYSIDTSAILWLHNDYYPQDVFPTLWEKIESLIKNGELKAIEIVLEELKGNEDNAYKWAKQQQRLFLPFDEKVESTAQTIRKSYYKTKDKNSEKDRADPFVIALAKQHGATVVSAEKRRGTQEAENKNPSIPFICEKLEIGHVNVLEFIRTEKWSF